MTKLSVKKLFHKYLCIALVSSIVLGCTSIPKTSTPITPIVERSTVTEKVVVKQDLGIITTYTITKDIALKVPSPDFVLEIPATSNKLVDYIVNRFQVSNKTATRIISFASKYSYETFPKRNDILAIIAVESRYNVRAYFKGCYGLMQIQKKSHGKLLIGRDLYNPEVNIEIGSKILNDYFKNLKNNKRATILSFNSGIGNYYKHRYNSVYYTKYNKELKLLNNL